jgi:hypothetical protein
MVSLPAPQIVSLLSRLSLLTYFFTIPSYIPSSFSFILKELKMFYVEEKIILFIYRLIDAAIPISAQTEEILIGSIIHITFFLL